MARSSRTPRRQSSLQRWKVKGDIQQRALKLKREAPGHGDEEPLLEAAARGGDIEERSFDCVHAPANTAGNARARANFAQDDGERPRRTNGAPEKSANFAQYDDSRQRRTNRAEEKARDFAQDGGSKQRRQSGDWRSQDGGRPTYSANGPLNAKYVHRAWHAMPLRRKTKAQYFVS